jgi:transcription elongation factor
MTFQPGDRIEMYPGEAHSYRADVLKVAKNGSVKIERWFSFMRVGEPELRREWLPASIAKTATLVRRRG